MSEFIPITTVEELILLDHEDMMQGYFAGLDGWPEPGNNRTRSFWHGWRNGAVDGGHRQPDAANHALARAIVKLPGGFQYVA